MRTNLFLSLALGGAGAFALSGLQCDASWDCSYRAKDGTFFDISKLCLTGFPYSYNNTATGRTYSFNVCGVASSECHPPYPREFSKGAAIAFFGSMNAGQTCTTNSGASVPCTQNCEVLGVGTPTITATNPIFPGQGLNVTHYSVPVLSGDPNTCPTDPNTGTMMERRVTFMLKCNPEYTTGAQVTAAYEESPCRTVIVVQSSVACGCAPSCLLSNCGPDGCGGYCGPQGALGQCPLGYTCIQDGGTTSNVCCKPDCRGRQCGADGCGGTCGSCNGTTTCNRYRQCVDPNIRPSQAAALPPARPLYTTGSSQYAGSFFGGGLTAALALAATVYYFRAKRLMGLAAKEAADAVSPSA